MTRLLMIAATALVLFATPAVGQLAPTKTFPQAPTITCTTYPPQWPGGPSTTVCR